MTFKDRIEIVWRRIVAIFTKAITVADKDFVELVGQEQADQFASAVIGLLKSEVGAIITDVVNDLTASDISNNPSARAAALSKILADLKANSLSVSEKTLNMLIELAIWVVENKISVK